jgi:hypothetical protein
MHSQTYLVNKLASLVSNEYRTRCSQLQPDRHKHPATIKSSETEILAQYSQIITIWMETYAILIFDRHVYWELTMKHSLSKR